jgi:hypothetical protein
MRMMKLLSAGKSLVGQNDGDKRYRMSDPKAMPRFGSERNPLLKKANATLPGSTSVSPAGCGSVTTGMHAGETPTLPGRDDCETGENLKATERGAEVSGEQVGSPLTSVLRLFGRAATPQDKQASVSPKVASTGTPSGEEQPAPAAVAGSISNNPRTLTAPPPRPSGLFAGWIATLRAIFSRGDRTRSSRPPFRAAAPVQGELSLDNVKPLGNDLSDTDFEVVTIKRAAAPKTEVVAAPTNAASVAQQKALDRVASLLGVGQS